MEKWDEHTITLIQLATELEYIVIGAHEKSFRQNAVINSVVEDQVKDIVSTMRDLKVSAFELAEGSAFQHYLTRKMNSLEQSILEVKGLDLYANEEKYIELVLEINTAGETVRKLLVVIDRKQVKRESDKKDIVDFVLDLEMKQEDDSMPVIKRPVRKG